MRLSDSAREAPRARVLEIQRCSIHDGPGIRTTVFLAGCSLRCAWCHNPESFDAKAGRLLTAADVLGEVLLDRAYYEASGGLTVSGGEPLLQPVFLRELLSSAQAEGLHACVQTAGGVPARAVLDVLDCVDLFQFDLKHMDPARHLELTGRDPSQIHANLRLLLARGATVEVRMPIVPGINDDDDNLDALGHFLADLGVAALHLVPYQRSYLEKYRLLGMTARCAAVTPPSRARLHDIKERLGRFDLSVIIDA